MVKFPDFSLRSGKTWKFYNSPKHILNLRNKFPDFSLRSGKSKKKYFKSKTHSRVQKLVSGFLVEVQKVLRNSKEWKTHLKFRNKFRNFFWFPESPWKFVRYHARSKAQSQVSEFFVEVQKVLKNFHEIKAHSKAQRRVSGVFLGGSDSPKIKTHSEAEKHVWRVLMTFQNSQKISESYWGPGKS